MPDVDVLAPGSFCWLELATSDQKAGVAFYRSLFGWDLQDFPMGPNESYSLLKIRGRDVAAACSLRTEEREHGVPPHWNAYIRVTSADESAARAQSLGGTVVAPPFDVMDNGRMAVLQDPTGAVFEVWQPNKTPGVGITNEPGALCWTELATRNPKSAEAFYTQMFGWTPKHSAPGAPMEYTEFSVNGQPSIGMMPMPPQVPAEVPSYWMPYFQTANVDESAAKAKTLGATVVVPPSDIPDAGRFSVLNDPQGAMFAIFTPKPRA